MSAKEALPMDSPPRFAIVTGGSRGIGRGIALELARQGIAGVAIADLREESARSVARELNTKGCRALAISVDLTRNEEAQRAVAEVIGEFGQVDVLVNNAGWDRVEP